ncbi:hypothetical protein [Neptuniibacter marinus]|uniref:hypothetical protein n=1 Tax=Neptuniibacter marinus TaxID=1806670 RepID=UPI00082D61D5|nr:hypothetical protein [Neptuniibacter marinus]
MENSILSTGLSTTLSTQRTDNSANQPPAPSSVNDSLANASTGAAERNRDLPATSQIPDINNPSETRTNRVNNTEEQTDPAVQQQQIENFLAEQTGADPALFQGIDIQTALDLQESLRNRPEQTEQASVSLAQQNAEQPVDSNEQQAQELQQRLQSRLAEQIANDPGTEFPQLIETVA